jgi:hypothetical protein
MQIQQATTRAATIGRMRWLVDDIRNQFRPLVRKPWRVIVWGAIVRVQAKSAVGFAHTSIARQTHCGRSGTPQKRPEPKRIIRPFRWCPNW